MTSTTNPNSHLNNQSHLTSLSILASLFFMWGFLTCLNDILIPHLKNVFDLTYFQAALIQFCFFGAYFIVSLPAGNFVKRIGYQRGIVVGLTIAAIGCMCFYPAASIKSFPAFLGSLFILAAGITILQVSANPYVTILGSPETASSRLTLTQALNSFGTFIAPFFGAAFILAASAPALSEMAAMSVTEIDALKQSNVESVQMPYIGLSIALLALAAFFYFVKLPAIEESSESQGSSTGSAWQHKHLVLGAIAIFMYVGAEVSIGSFLINFFGESHIANMEEASAGKLIAFYWGGAMVGRFVGAFVMQHIAANKVLAFNACVSISLVVVAMNTSGNIAMWSILGVGLFNSIMFPTIFSLGVDKLGEHRSQGSGILCMGIVGGALIPLVQGYAADSVSLQTSFIVPALCYLFIIYYGIKGYKPAV